ncbi:NAD(P)-binding protein [Aureobasidium sp. EXF-8845]|nr:NAD(P)-binding protein [Aureobasidium sp. EXF-8845]KAI4857644.1 NAD(P)-binding protein [Aureobasidium sp. EXF-8846]
MFGFGMSGSFDPVQRIPDLSGKVIFVTGGNVGIGKESIIQLAKHNPKAIYMTSRSAEKAEKAVQDVLAVVPKANVKIISLDLTDFASIKQAAEHFTSTSSRLDLLINNAGVMAMPYSHTKQNYDIQFGTNHLGHALLVKLLLPTLLKTAELPNSDVRIINLASYGHNFAPSGGILFDEKKAEQASPSARYGSSKLANILHARVLAERYPQLTVTAVHPGVIKTDLYATVNSGTVARCMSSVVMPLFFRDVQDGAWNTLWAATTDKKEVRKNYYFEPVGQAVAGSKYAQDRQLGEKLWNFTEGEFVRHGY